MRRGRGAVSLLCSLGRHRPAALPRWNDGFYFTRCERCGQDLVRTAFTGWHVPEGYRVVWSATPPVERPDVGLIPQPAEAEPVSPPEVVAEPVAAAPAPAEEAARQDPLPPAISPEPADSPAPAPLAEPETRQAPPESLAGNARSLPIEQVFQELRSATDAGQHEGAPPASRRPYWDFMEEEGSAARGGVSGAGRTGFTGLAPTAETGKRDGLDETAAAALALGRRALGAAWGGASRFGQALRRGAERPMPLLGLALALIVAGILAATLAITTGFRFSSGPAELQARPAGQEDGAPVPVAGRAVNRAYVAARVLSCRDAPARNAERVRNLGRGTPVDLLGDDGEWVSIAYRGRQCWVQARFLSPLPPY